MNTEHNKISTPESTPFDNALLSEVEGLRVNGINQRFLKYYILRQILHPSTSLRTNGINQNFLIERSGAKNNTQTCIIPESSRLCILRINYPCL